MMSMSEDSKRKDIVLVVDDTPETLGFVTTTLDMAGFTVLVATSGESALELVDRVTPDLVLMDAVMPSMDGFETCRQLKREKRLAHVPVVFMTGLSETEHIVRGLSAGGVDYVTKPIVVDELLARIRVHLGNARIAHASQSALDASGRFLLASNADGRLKWCTPRAERLLARVFPGEYDHEKGTLPAAVASALQRIREIGAQGLQPRSVVGVDGQRLELSFLSALGEDEYLFRVTEVEERGSEAQLRQALGLTSREAEVLLWLSRGKSNRDIGQILGISPRTVNKHLEQVFVKLGVENRASAAACAVRLLNP